MAITFQNQDIEFKVQDKTKLKIWIRKIIGLEKKRTGNINFVFTHDRSLLKINREFLKHDTYTDIITFDSCIENTIHGDIIISVERVAENAHTYKVDFKKELHRVIIHGILHLCGYKDKSKAEAKLIRSKEDAALKKLDLTY